MYKVLCTIQYATYCVSETGAPRGSTTTPKRPSVTVVPAVNEGAVTRLNVLDRAMPVPRPLSRTISERVHSFIQQALFAGHLNPGDRLGEEELAGALGVSRTPIREALRQLDSDGLVVVVPRRGAFVRRLDPDRARQLYQARLLIETEAARVAASRITADQLKELRPLADAALDDASRGDLGDAFVDTEAFHVVVFKAADNDVLLDLWRRVWAEWQLFRVCAWRFTPGRPRAAATEHAALYRALAAHDHERAAAVMTRHIEKAWSHVARSLEQAPEGG